MRSLADLLSRTGPILMGILNVTPDSFSDGGEFVSPDRAVEYALQMARDGAEIIDIGGESTRPAGKTYGMGAESVSLEEELERVIPVIQAIRRKDTRTLLSIDTQKSEVAELAMEEGADIINDVSAGTSDPGMFRTAANRKIPIILMHGHGPRFRKAKIEEYAYEDVVSEVYEYLQERIHVAREAGVFEILADVGIGFAKRYEDNLRLIKYHEAFASLGIPLVLGVSRKSSIGRAMGSDPTPKERLPGSIAAALYASEHGAKIIRTHDVRETRESLNVLNAIHRS